MRLGFMALGVLHLRAVPLQSMALAGLGVTGFRVRDRFGEGFGFVTGVTAPLLCVLSFAALRFDGCVRFAASAGTVTSSFY